MLPTVRASAGGGVDRMLLPSSDRWARPPLSSLKRPKALWPGPEDSRNRLSRCDLLTEDRNRSVVARALLPRNRSPREWGLCRHEGSTCHAFARGKRPGRERGVRVGGLQSVSLVSIRILFKGGPRGQSCHPYANRRDQASCGLVPCGGGTAQGGGRQKSDLMQEERGNGGQVWISA